MKSLKHLLTAGIGFAFLFVLCGNTSWAVAAFAKKYGVACSMSHHPVPTLNAFGHRFRKRRHRMPEENTKDPLVDNAPDDFPARPPAPHNHADPHRHNHDEYLNHYNVHDYDNGARYDATCDHSAKRCSR